MFEECSDKLIAKTESNTKADNRVTEKFYSLIRTRVDIPLFRLRYISVSALLIISIRKARFHQKVSAKHFCRQGGNANT